RHAEGGRRWRARFLPRQRRELGPLDRLAIGEAGGGRPAGLPWRGAGWRETPPSSAHGFLEGFPCNSLPLPAGALSGSGFGNSHNGTAEDACPELCEG